MFSSLKLIGLIILSIFVFTGTVHGFETADLEGTWHFHSTAMDNGTFISMTRGTAIFDASGNVTGGTYEVLGHQGGTLTAGQFTVSAAGDISGYINSTLGINSTVRDGLMAESGTTFCTVSYSTSSEWSLDIWTKAGGSFSASDLAGTWYCDALIYGTGLGTGAMTAYGTIEFDGTGENKNAQFMLSDDSAYQHTGGVLNLSGAGLLTGVAQDDKGYTFTVDYGKMDPGKSMLPVTAQSDVGDGLEYFAMLTRTGGTFSQKNMGGKWFTCLFSREGGLQICRYGTVDVDTTGKITGGSMTTSTGQTISDVSGTLNLSAAGVMSGNFDIGGTKTVKHAKMNKEKDVVQGQVLDGENGGLLYMVRNVEQVASNVNQLNFSYIIDGDLPAPQTISLASENGATNWNAAPTGSWITISQNSGTGSGSIEVTVDPTGLASGTYLSSVEVTVAAHVEPVLVNLTIYSPGNTTAPFGVFASPREDVVHQGSIPLTGWALDDTGIRAVTIYLESDGKLNALDQAIFVQGARPDVETAFPGYPYNYLAGWGYMLLTNYLPGGGNGTYTLHAIATDLEGNTTSLGTKTITCDNANAVKPFGALDTPTQGGIASGDKFVNFGWVLTPMPNSIATDGSTISVFVDGVNVGNPVYNQYRKDIAAYFPGLANTNGAVGYFYLDTTTYNDGLHSIQWTATDSGGNTDGIGSRYFMIQNTNSEERGKTSVRLTVDGKPGPVPAPPVETVYVSQGTLKIKEGFSGNGAYRELIPDKDNVFHIAANELEPLEIRLPTGSEKQPPWFKGCQVNGVNLRPLPIGSTFDRENNAFYWQPGFGFLGNYLLRFETGNSHGEQSCINILVTILPKSTVTNLPEKEKLPKSGQQ